MGPKTAELVPVTSMHKFLNICESVADTSTLLDCLFIPHLACMLVHILLALPRYYWYIFSNSVMIADQSDTVSLSETNLAKANSLPYSSRLSTVVSPSEANSTSSTTKDSLIYSMIAGNSTGSKCTFL